jgi:predicted nucleic acid-binding protein
LILVDSSVWIDFFASAQRPAGAELARLIKESAPLSVTGIVMTEVLQGLTREIIQIEHYLSMFEMLEPSGLATYREAASIFRLSRSKGVSLTTTDAIIAAIALEHEAALFTRDRDFLHIERFIKLRFHPFASVS